MQRTQKGYLPFKDDKLKDAKNSSIEAYSVLAVKATIIDKGKDIEFLISLPFLVASNIFLCRFITNLHFLEKSSCINFQNMVIC